MDPGEIVAELEVNADRIAALFQGVSDERARWRPAPGKWSMLEVLSHLCDEERDDFRKRLRLLLESPGAEWPPIDPEGWARERGYNARVLAAALEDFLAERAFSIAWLRGLVDPDWKSIHNHPSLGAIRAGDLLVSWLLHDELHLRQIAGACAAFVSTHSAPFSTAYASP